MYEVPKSLSAIHVQVAKYQVEKKLRELEHKLSLQTGASSHSEKQMREVQSSCLQLKRQLSDLGAAQDKLSTLGIIHGSVLRKLS